MKFHPDKCKVLIVHNTRKILHGDDKNHIYSPYTLDNVPLKSVGVEKDLGVDMTPKLNWEHQINRLCSKASQKLGLLRRNCYFVKNLRQARTLYITLVRSIFEHCSVIWRPTNRTLSEKIENIQKKAMKWVLKEENLSYSCKSVYLRKCKELNLLPMEHRFNFTDLLMLHKIVYKTVPIELPSYLHFFSGQSRLRFCHLDKLSLVSDILPNTTACSTRSSNALANSFFYRVHLLWNELPFEIREIECHLKFKSSLKTHLSGKAYKFECDTENGDDD